MNKLTKLDASEELSTKLNNFHARMVELKKAGEPIPESLKSSYKIARVLVVKETHEKCVYCESKVSHVYPGDVEHLIAKSKRPELTFDYGNLSYACSVCNNNKSDYHDPLLQLINPYIDEPAVEFVALGPLVKDRPGHDRAFVTEQTLELNRPSLIERRRDRIESLHKLAMVYEKAAAGPMKVLLKGQLLQEAQDDKDYAFVVRGYLKDAVNMSA
jgi:hypothetical protein